MTWATTWTQIANVVQAFEDRRANFALYLAQEATIIAALDLDAYNTAEVTNGVRAFRASLDSVARTAGGLLAGYVLELGRLVSEPERKLGPALVALRRYMIDNPDALTPPRIRSRQFVRGTWDASSGNLNNGGVNVGNGTVLRLLVDEDGFPLENTHAETFSLEVVTDRQGGADLWRETFEVKGKPKPDSLTLYQAGFGSGLRSGDGRQPYLASASPDDTKEFLLNSSFSAYGGSDPAAPTSLTGWTFLAGAVTDVEIDQTAADLYQEGLDESTPGALKVKASITIQQKLSDSRRSNLEGAPVYIEVPLKGDLAGGWTGDVRIDWGSKSKTITLDGTEVGWFTTLKLPVDKNLYLKNYNQDDIGLKITVTKTSAAATRLLIDSIKVVRWKAYDNQWILPISGRTAWLKGDRGVFADTETGAKIQRMFHRGLGASLPSAPVAPASAPTVALAGAGAGNVDNGTHSYKVTYRRLISDTDYAESGPSAVSGTVTVADKTVDGKVSLTAIPTGPSGTSQRRLWRTAAGLAVPGPWKLFATLNDNTTTVYTDNTADAGLGANVGTGITDDDPA